MITKKITLIISAVALLFSSCMKDYDCECTHTGVEGIDTTWVSHTTVTNTKKKDAQSNCEYLGGTNYSGQVVIEEVCTLK